MDEQPLEKKVEDTGIKDKRVDKTIPTDMCINHLISREQRKSEVARGEGLTGTKNYEDTGCYECEGYRYRCDSYQPNEIPRK